MIKIDLNEWREEAQHHDPEMKACEDIYDAAETVFVALQKEGEERFATGRDKIEAMKNHPELVAAHAIAHAVNRFELSYRTLKIEELRLLAAANGKTLCHEDMGTTDQLLTDVCISVQDIFSAAVDAFCFSMNDRNGSSSSAAKEDRVKFVKANPELFAGFYRVFFAEYYRIFSDDAAYYRSQGHLGGESQEGKKR